MSYVLIYLAQIYNDTNHIHLSTLTSPPTKKKCLMGFFFNIKEIKIAQKKTNREKEKKYLYILEIFTKYSPIYKYIYII